MKRYSIIVGIDFSKESDHALDCALRFAAPTDNVRVHALHVSPTWDDRQRWTGAPLESWPLERREEWQIANQLLIDLARRCGERRMLIEPSSRPSPRQLCVHIKRGRAATELVAFARRIGSGLLIVGTHSRQGVARLMAGSVAERVVRLAPCAVFVARRPELVDVRIALPGATNIDAQRHHGS